MYMYVCAVSFSLQSQLVLLLRFVFFKIQLNPGVAFNGSKSTTYNSIRL